MAEKTTGRGRKTTKKTTKQPIPIDAGVAGQSQPRAAALHSEDASRSTAAENTPATPVYPAIEEEIRLRAYELYEERGRQDGYQEEDWARAETEILSRRQREKSA